MTRWRLSLFVAMAVLAAAVCVRLGFWQLSRREQRRARNALVIARLQSPPVDPRALPTDTSLVRFRQVRVEGTPDYSHELILAARTHNGSPGVNLLTPVRLAGTDTAVLVNRGWVYSPDGSTVDTSRTRERVSVFQGFANPLPAGAGAVYATRPNVISKFSYDIVAKSLPYPILPFYVLALGDTTTEDASQTASPIARLTIPALDEGPHLSYAIQWFGFAAVALVGAGIVIRQSRRDAARDGRSGDGRGGARGGAGESR